MGTVYENSWWYSAGTAYRKNRNHRAAVTSFSDNPDCLEGVHFCCISGFNPIHPIYDGEAPSHIFPEERRSNFGLAILLYLGV